MRPKLDPPFVKAERPNVNLDRQTVNVHDAEVDRKAQYVSP